MQPLRENNKRRKQTNPAFSRLFSPTAEKFSKLLLQFSTMKNYFTLRTFLT
jgi:hypothetical protein